MTIGTRLRRIIKRSIITVQKGNLPSDKHMSELAYWRDRYLKENRIFNNSHYERIMLSMAGENDDEFMAGKKVADFGCGPRGSLVWINSAALKIGIDVLADLYADEFKENIISHDMVYLKSTEKVIPLPTNYVDILYTQNALDHVRYFSIMCAELIRVLKPGGELIGSFNLYDPPSTNEPHTLTPEMIQKELLDNFEVKSHRIVNQGSRNDYYASFFAEQDNYIDGQRGILWVRASNL